MSFLDKREINMVEKGYGKVVIHSIAFDRSFSDNQKRTNLIKAKSMTKEEWSEYCLQFSKSLEKPMLEIKNLFASKYDIHQVSVETSTMEHYKSNWDLYFWHNTNRPYMDYFTLTFNSKRTAEQNMDLLREITSFVELLDYHPSVECHIVYKIQYDEEKIKMDSGKICEDLKNKFIIHRGIVGKIKVIDSNGEKRYVFFPKGKKKKYLELSLNELLTA